MRRFLYWKSSYWQLLHNLESAATRLISGSKQSSGETLRRADVFIIGMAEFVRSDVFSEPAMPRDTGNALTKAIAIRKS